MISQKTRTKTKTKIPVAVIAIAILGLGAVSLAAIIIGSPGSSCKPLYNKRISIAAEPRDAASKLWFTVLNDGKFIECEEFDGGRICEFTNDSKIQAEVTAKENYVVTALEGCSKQKGLGTAFATCLVGTSSRIIAKIEAAGTVIPPINPPKDSYTLRIIKNGSGSGSISGDMDCKFDDSLSCEKEFPRGKQIKLQANPKEGSYTSWVNYKDPKKPIVQCSSWSDFSKNECLLSYLTGDQMELMVSFFPKITCENGQKDCDGKCVDSKNDSRNCGLCGVDCGDGYCRDGECNTKEDCPVGPSWLYRNMKRCDLVVNRGAGPQEYIARDTCTDLNTDQYNCGGCGNECNIETQRCREGKCIEKCSLSDDNWCGNPSASQSGAWSCVKCPQGSKCMSGICIEACVDTEEGKEITNYQHELKMMIPNTDPNPDPNYKGNFPYYSFNDATVINKIKYGNDKVHAFEVWCADKYDCQYQEFTQIRPGVWEPIDSQIKHCLEMENSTLLKKRIKYDQK